MYKQESKALLVKMLHYNLKSKYENIVPAHRDMQGEVAQVRQRYAIN